MIPVTGKFHGRIDDVFFFSKSSCHITFIGWSTSFNFSVLDADPQLLFRHVLAKAGWSKVGLVFFLLTFYFCIWLIGIAHVTWFAAGLQGLTCDLGAKLRAIIAPLSIMAPFPFIQPTQV